MIRNLPLALLAISGVLFSTIANAEQFVLFDQTFTFEQADAIPTKSHLYVNSDDFGKGTPKDWTQPVDYRNGTVHVRMEVLEKPAGEVGTTWSLCYLPNKGQKNNYGCVGSPHYKTTGVYEKDVKMNDFWENDSIVWTEGIKRMSLVIKAAGKGGQGHAHKQPDLSLFFPTKIRVSMIQVSKDAKYNDSWLKK